MTSEPPDEYVAFVARHLEPLRRDAARVVGDEHDADLLYAEVLTEVAVRWQWLELLRKRLYRDRAAELYLNRVFARRAERWQPGGEDAPPELRIEVSAWHPDGFQPPPRPVYLSNAVQLAPLIAPRRRVVAPPICEAAIAWWHAYEVRRRNKFIAAGAVFLACLLVLAHFSAPPI